MSESGISVDAMRRIDRLAGVPLCFLATLAVKLRDLVWRRPPRPIRRILFIELSEMGSTILADPALRKSLKAEGDRPPARLAKKGRKRIDGQREMLLPISGKKAKEGPDKRAARPAARRKAG